MQQLPGNAGACTRRQNQDGTIDSVCSRCRLTIARAYRPSDLSDLEVRHVCQPFERRRTTRIAHRVYDPSKNRA
jgi:hypothetical protein